MVMVEGMKVLDPRTGEIKASDNPALLLLDFVLKYFNPSSTNEYDRFLADIGKIADYCDSQNIHLNLYSKPPTVGLGENHGHI